MFTPTLTHRNHVAFFVDLLEGFLRRAVHLELKDIDPVLCPADGVRSSDGRLDLGLGVVAEEREDKVDDCLVVFLSLVLQIVGNAGHEGLEEFKGTVHIVVLQSLVELQHE